MKRHTQAFEEKYSSMARQMSKWIDNVLSQNYPRTGREWAPSVNLYEDAERFMVVVDLSGIKPEEIDLRVENDMLLLTGERATPRPEKHEGPCKTHLMEIDHGAFSRAVELPASVDVDRISARYCTGQLWVEMPKKR